MRLALRALALAAAVALAEAGSCDDYEDSDKPCCYASWDGPGPPGAFKHP